MNQTCKVCGEPAAGFHFGAFTCEGCKSFFGRSYNNLSSISECKNNGKCIIDKKNRTTCKACRLRKCYTVGMSKGGSRYGRRSNWFKIHCLLQEQQQQAVEAAGKAGVGGGGSPAAGAGGFSDMAAAVAAHLQPRNPHGLPGAPPHMSALLSYPPYIPEMMQGSSPFLAAATAGRHPDAAPNTLPFFAMMNSLPPQFQLPPHLLFSGYHSNAAAAAAAAAFDADAAYRSDMYKHRQSVDSASSADSQRYSPVRSAASGESIEQEREPLSTSSYAGPTMPERAESPELCVSGDDDEHTTSGSHKASIASAHHHQQQSQQEHDNHHQHSHSQHHHHHHHHQHYPQQHKHSIHNPIAIRATAPSQQISPALYTAAPTPIPTPTPTSTSKPNTPEPCVDVTEPTPIRPVNSELNEPTHSFHAKLQPLSPVSVCSTGADSATVPTASATAAAAAASTVDASSADQDCPMDLSMKASHSSVHSLNVSAGESDANSEVSVEEMRQDARRKFYQLSSESDTSSDMSSHASTEAEVVKRQKLVVDEAAGYTSFTAANSMRGIFVCV